MSGAPDPRIEAYLGTLDKWGEETRRLRALALSRPLKETMKWGQPCYALDGANVVLIHGFKAYCALLFFKGALLRDDEKRLVRQSENVTAPRQMRFADLAEIEAHAGTIGVYLDEAIVIARAGHKVAGPAAPSAPPEWTQALAADPPLRDAFEKLTPGRRRGYLLHFAGAKQPATRQARIARWRAAILAGHGLDD